MPELDIVKLVVTPMQRFVVQLGGFEDLEVESIAYGLQRQVGPDEDPAPLVTDTVLGPPAVWRSGPLAAPANYVFSVLVTYANQVQEGFSMPIRMEPLRSMATMLRQSVWDILEKAEIVGVAGSQLWPFHDGYFRPSILRKADDFSARLPAVEVGMPRLKQTQIKSPVREAEIWEVPIRVMDAIDGNNADETEDLWRLAEQVKRVVNLTQNLNLSRWGVLSQAWSWQIREALVLERDRMSGLMMRLSVMVEREIAEVP